MYLVSMWQEGFKGSESCCSTTPWPAGDVFTVKLEPGQRGDRSQEGELRYKVPDGRDELHLL